MCVCLCLYIYKKAYWGRAHWKNHYFLSREELSWDGRTGWESKTGIKMTEIIFTLSVWLGMALKCFSPSWRYQCLKTVMGKKPKILTTKDKILTVSTAMLYPAFVGEQPDYSYEQWVPA